MVGKNDTGAFEGIGLTVLSFCRPMRSYLSAREGAGLFELGAVVYGSDEAAEPHYVMLRFKFDDVAVFVKPCFCG